jgi:hypothetical protein
MLFSYSAFKKEKQVEYNCREECQCEDIETDQAISELMETVQSDILEAEEIKFA